MAKIHKLVDPLQSGTSQQALLTDWSKCIFCQEDLSEALHCPPESRHNTLGTGYKTITDLVACLNHLIYHIRITVMELRQHFSSTMLSGMMNVEFNIIKLK